MNTLAHQSSNLAPSYSRSFLRATTALLGLSAIALLSGSAMAGAPAKAVTTVAPKSDSFFNFSASSVTYLYGLNWDVPFSNSKDRDIITIEHYDDNKLGDLFFFVDFANIATHGGATPGAGFDIYGEIDPRLSLSKLTGTSYKTGILKDFYIYSGTLEVGYSNSLGNVNKAFGLTLDKSHLAQLHGVAVDLDIPGFQVMSLNAYWRDDTDLHGSTWQLTAVWAAPFKLFGADFVFKGFADYNGAEGGTHSTFHTSPQLMMDVGDKLFHKKGMFYFGTEVDIWVNEFGVKGQNDVVPQIIAQVVF